MADAPKVLILAGDFTEDYEIMVPYQALSMMGVQAHTVCPEKKCGELVKTAIHDFEGDQTYTEKPGHLFMLNADFDQVRAEDYDALYLTGGRSPEYLRLDSRVLSLTRKFIYDGKPVAAICHGVQILTAANVLRGRRLTAYDAVGPEVELAGGTFVKLPPDGVCVDGNLITSPAWPGNTVILRELLLALGMKVTWER